jgi:hypothetical protein
MIAALEGGLINILESRVIGEQQGSQSITSLKCTQANTDNGSGNPEITQVVAIAECPLTYSFKRWFCPISNMVNIAIPKERIRRDRSQSVWNYHDAQLRAWKPCAAYRVGRTTQPEAADTGRPSEAHAAKV